MKFKLSKPFLLAFCFLAFTASLAYVVTSCTPVIAHAAPAPVNTIKYPWGAANTVSLTATGNQVVNCINNVTIVDGVTTQATTSHTIGFTFDAQLMSGARVFLKYKTSGTDTLYFTGGGITNAAINGTATKIWCQSYTYDGTQLWPDGAAVKVN